MLRPLLILLALLVAGSGALAQEPSSVLLWSGKSSLPETSLFREYREARETSRFIAEPIVEGETLETLLDRLGVMERDIKPAARAILAEAGLEELPAGTTVRLKFMKSPATPFEIAAGRYPRALQAMEVLLGRERLVSVHRGANGFTAQTRPVEIETRFMAAAAEIDRSLFAAAAGAGIPRDVMLGFADIFAFDVDFARQIFRGDKFELVYEVFIGADGEELGVGDILFAALTWQGGSQSEGYYRFTPQGAEKAGHYNAKGRNPRTLLMKTPINGARVTSRFGKRRHPVLGYTKGHSGIDFGAPRGTPVLAAGDGVVTIAERRGTLGNYVRIEHSGGYETAYAHLHGYARGVTKGKQVKQGEVIGYVGSTGRSTGPHLHYEVISNGQHQDPEKVKVAVGDTLTESTLQDFIAYRDGIDSLRITPFAVADARLP